MKRRFGELAVALGYLSTARLRHVLAVQEHERTQGEPLRPLGLICMQEGFLTFDQVMRVLECQGPVEGPVDLLA